MTILESAGARLATVVGNYLQDDAGGLLWALRDELGRYREAEKEHSIAQAANALQDNDQ